ncbi:hypothetical protein [Shewanella colwelliana]|uniref:hypothetical protein n=1 Tax=Shewanella colwelliana TaxID=23 RepID=UPI0022AECA0F|nr:hypothetical protein [Shewanella colwelliana]MCZ4336100.1 hypothetical protein [Shewanella colwelliana]
MDGISASQKSVCTFLAGQALSSNEGATFKIAASKPNVKDGQPSFKGNSRY